MKYKIFILILAAILVIPAVAAGDNATDHQIADSINVTFQEKTYIRNITDIEVELPEEANGTLRAQIDDLEIYNENITNKSVKIPITLPKPKFPYIISRFPPDSSVYKINIFYNDIEVKVNHTLQVMNYLPNHTQNAFRMTGEILKDDQYFGPLIWFPSSARGEVEVFIDGEFLGKYNASFPYLILNSSMFASLPIGTHSVNVYYSGDDYYLGFNRTESFNVTDVLIQIPENMLLDHDDCISVRTLEHTDGEVSVYVDGKLFIRKKLEGGEFLKSMFDLSCGKHEIEVNFTSKNAKRSKKVSVNVSYVIYQPTFTVFSYGEDNILDFYAVNDLNAKLIRVTINGTDYPARMDDNFAVVNISRLGAGNYSGVFSYLGDDKYDAQTVEFNFTVKYAINVPYYLQFGGYNNVTLKMPKDAKGKLEVYVNDKLYKSKSFSKGFAAVSLGGLSVGRYNVTVRYSGSDYDVESAESVIVMSPRIRYSSIIYEGDDKYVTLETSKDAKGYVIFDTGKKKYNVTIKNGKASLSLKNLKAGDYDIDIEYRGADGYLDYFYACPEIMHCEVKIADVKKPIYNSYYRFKVYINSKLIKNRVVKVKIGKKTFNVKTSSKGIADVKLPSALKAKKYVMTVTYASVKAKKTVKIRHAVSLKVKRHSKKITLQAKLKKVSGKYLKAKKITFKINGKTIKAKTNSKGIARIDITKHKGKTNIAVSYLNDSIKKTVKIK